MLKHLNEIKRKGVAANSDWEEIYNMVSLGESSLPSDSLDPPTPADLASSAKLTSSLQAMGLFEGEEEAGRRQKVLAVVGACVTKHFQGLASARSVPNVDKAGAKVRCTFGKWLSVCLSVCL